MNSKKFVKRWLWISNETTVLFTVVWNKLYLRDFFADDMFFEALRIHEDEEFSTGLFLKNFKITFLDEPFYYYRANQESVTYRPFAEVYWVFFTKGAGHTKIVAGSSFQDMQPRTSVKFISTACGRLLTLDILNG